MFSVPVVRPPNSWVFTDLVTKKYQFSMCATGSKLPLVPCGRGCLRRINETLRVFFQDIY